MPRHVRGGADIATLTLDDASPGTGPQAGSPQAQQGGPGPGATFGMLLPAIMSTAQQFINKGKPRAPAVRSFFNKMADIYATGTPEARGLLDAIGGDTLEGFMAWVEQGMGERGQRALEWANMAGNLGGMSGGGLFDFMANMGTAGLYGELTGRRPWYLPAKQVAKAGNLAGMSGGVNPKPKSYAEMTLEERRNQPAQERQRIYDRENRRLERADMYDESRMSKRYRPIGEERNRRREERQRRGQEDNEFLAQDLVKKASNEFAAADSARARGGRKGLKAYRERQEATTRTQANVMGAQMERNKKQREKDLEAAKRLGYVDPKATAQAQGQQGLADAGRAGQVGILAPTGGRGCNACGSAAPSAGFLRKVLGKYGNHGAGVFSSKGAKVAPEPNAHLREAYRVATNKAKAREGRAEVPAPRNIRAQYVDAIRRDAEMRQGWEYRPYNQKGSQWLVRSWDARYQKDILGPHPRGEMPPPEVKRYIMENPLGPGMPMADSGVDLPAVYAEAGVPYPYTP